MRHLIKYCTFMLFASLALAQVEDPLPSWRNAATKQRIIAFVQTVTEEDGEGFVEPAKRIATFDNDGTLWSEQPIYFQAFFIFDRIRELASDHPEWKEQEPFSFVLKGDFKSALAGGEHAVLEMAMTTCAGMTSEEFEKAVVDWLATAKHPATGRLYTQMVYQPMLELLDYLRDNGFKTYIVSGGGIDFMRVFCEEVYGIPPEQVIGSSIKCEYKLVEGKPAIVKLPEINFIDDKEGKPVGIYQHIGRRPIFAAGNSDGDFQMLEWTTSGVGARCGLLVHHTDAEREYAYDRKSSVGRLSRGLDEAPKRGWMVVDMANDWKCIYPEE